MGGCVCCTFYDSATQSLRVPESEGQAGPEHHLMPSVRAGAQDGKPAPPRAVQIRAHLSTKDKLHLALTFQGNCHVASLKDWAYILNTKHEKLHPFPSHTPRELGFSPNTSLM